MDQNECSIPHCGREIHTRKSGLCQSHYLSARRNEGAPEYVIRGVKTPAEKAQILRDHAFEPLEEYPGSKKRWLVKCPNGHEVRVSVERLDENEQPCEECRRPNLLETHPHLADWWDYSANGDLRPEQFSKGSEQKVHWKCPVGHSPVSEVYVQANAERLRCGVCNGYQVVEGINDLDSQHPELARLLWAHDLNELPADRVYFASTKTYNWRCSRGHNFSSSPFDMRVSLRKEREGCPYCHNIKTWKGWNDLATVSPSLTEEYIRGGNSVPPDEICAFTSQRARWVCSHGHKGWESTVGSRVRRRSSCPACVGIVTNSGNNDALTANPALRELWSLEDNGPLEVLANTAKSSSQSFRWLCLEFPHTFQATVTAAVRGVLCAVCGNRELLAGFNDLESAKCFPEFDLGKTVAHSDQFGWTVDELAPTLIRTSDKRRVWWRCAKNQGHSWDTSLAARVGNDSGCPFCAGNRVSPGENDLGTKFSELVPEWSQLNSLPPNQVAFGSQTKVWWVCRAGKEHPDYEASPKNRTGPNATGCPDCNTGGFETSKPAYLYLIEHEEFGALKIGISNSDSRPNRLSIWSTRGWSIISRWDDDYGKTIKDTEQAVLRVFVRGQLGLAQALTKQEMGGEGQNETFERRPGVAEAVIAEVQKTLARFQATNRSLRKR